MLKVDISNVKGESFLNLPNIPDSSLPTVTIVTPTCNRLDVFDIAIRNYKSFNYPRDKLKWIILDDTESTGGTNKLEKLINKNFNGDNSVRYIYSEVKEPIGKKRNMLAEEVQTTVICHMDDDDYYYPDSVKIRVIAMLAYKKAVSGCIEYNCYNLVDDSQFIASGNEETLNIGEASLCYLKSYWENHRYCDTDTHEESIEFLKGSINEYVNVPCLWILLSITHGRNVSGRRAIAPVLAFSFLDALPVNDYEYIKSMKLKLMMKDPLNARCATIIKNIQSNKNPQKIIERMTIEERKNVIIREYLNTMPTKTTCSELDYLIVCFPGQYIRELDFEKETKLVEFVKKNKNNYRFTIYTDCDNGYSFDTLTLSPWWKWRTSNKYHKVLIWNEPSHLKLNINCRNVMFYNEHSFNVPEMSRANVITELE